MNPARFFFRAAGPACPCCDTSPCCWRPASVLKLSERTRTSLFRGRTACCAWTRRFTPATCARTTRRGMARSGPRTIRGSRAAASCFKTSSCSTSPGRCDAGMARTGPRRTWGRSSWSSSSRGRLAIRFTPSRSRGQRPSPPATRSQRRGTRGTIHTHFIFILRTTNGVGLAVPQLMKPNPLIQFDIAGPPQCWEETNCSAVNVKPASWFVCGLSTRLIFKTLT